MRARQVVFIVLSLLTCAFCGVLRMRVDPVQGFFEGIPFVLLLFWLWAAPVVGFAWYASRPPAPAPRQTPEEAPPTGSIALGMASILLGCAVIISAYQAAAVAIARIGAGMLKVGFLVLCGTMALPAGIAFCLLGLRYTKKEPTAFSGVALACGVLWLVGQFCDRFSTFLVPGSVPEQQFFVLFSLCGMAFLYTHAKLLGGVLPQQTSAVVFWGLLTALFAALYAVLALPHPPGADMPLWVYPLGCYAGVFSLRPQYGQQKNVN